MLEKLEAFAAARSHPLVELAFAWLLAHPQVSSVIAGATTRADRANAKAADWHLSAAEMQEISMAFCKRWPIRGIPQRHTCGPSGRGVFCREGWGRNQVGIDTWPVARQSCHPGAEATAPCRSLQAPLSILWEAKRMSIPNETLQAMIRAYHGFALTDDELELVRPELESYLKEVENSVNWTSRA